MYILIRDDIPLGKAITAAAHASLAMYLKFQDKPEVKHWLDPGPFKKVICKVTAQEFEKLKGSVIPYVVLRESTLDNQEVALAFLPQITYPKIFRFLRLYKENE